MWLKLHSVFLLYVLFSLVSSEQEIIVTPSENAESELLQVIIITRHGDRTPTKVFPLTKSEWPEGLGQLTHVGVKEHFELGQKFRRIYIEEKKFINASYRPNEVYVKSSPKERTLMSAHSFMLGFFPPGTGPNSIPHAIQPVPIYSSDKASDHLLYAYKNCPRLKTLAKQIEATEEWLEMHTKHSGLLSRLENIVGKKISLKEVTGILNIINGETIHNKTRLEGITEEVVHSLKEISNWVFKHKFHSREMGRLGAGNLVAEIQSRFNRSIVAHKEGRKADHRFILFSGHDGTLLALMAALGWTHLDVPPYASQFVFELHYHPDHGYYVNVLYNGEQVEHPGCSEICLFDQFHQLNAESIPLDWHTECQLKDSNPSYLKDNSYNYEEHIPIAAGVFIGIAIGLFFGKACGKKEKTQ